MRSKNKKLTDDDIAHYCKGVEELLIAIHEKSSMKKRKKTVAVEDEEYVPSDEDVFVVS
jgi:hypothetical protein